MKLRYKIALPFLWEAVGYFAVFPLFYLLRFVTEDMIYAFLCDRLPAIFTLYNPITDPAGYRWQSLCLSVISAFFTLYLLHRILLRCDGYRYKHTVTERGGMFPLKEGASRYLRGFAVYDLIVALSVPLLLTLITAFLPDNVMAGAFVSRYFLSVPKVICDGFGLKPGALVLCLISSITRLLASLAVVRDWRAIWLSDVVLP